MQPQGKPIKNKRGTVVSRQNQPGSALGFINNEQLRNRSSMSKYQTLQKDYAFRSSYSPNPKKNCFREPSPLSWKVGNSKKNPTTNVVSTKQKNSAVSEKPKNPGATSTLKYNKQSAAAIQNYFDNSKMLLNNSVTYAAKSSSKKAKKRGVVASKVSKYKQTDEPKAKISSNSGWEMLANLSSSSRERKYAINSLSKSKKMGADELLNDVDANKNI